MEVTSVKIKLIEGSQTKLKAIASITIDDAISIHDIKILDGDKGIFIAMPSRKNSAGEFKDIVHAINSETRAILTDKILEEYNKLI